MPGRSLPMITRALLDIAWLSLPRNATNTGKKKATTFYATLPVKTDKSGIKDAERRGIAQHGDAVPQLVPDGGKRRRSPPRPRSLRCARLAFPWLGLQAAGAADGQRKSAG